MFSHVTCMLIGSFKTSVLGIERKQRKPVLPTCTSKWKVLPVRDSRTQTTVERPWVERAHTSQCDNETTWKDTRQWRLGMQNMQYAECNIWMLCSRIVGKSRLRYRAGGDGGHGDNNEPWQQKLHTTHKDMLLTKSWMNHLMSSSPELWAIEPGWWVLRLQHMNGDQKLLHAISRGPGDTPSPVRTLRWLLKSAIHICSHWQFPG